MCIRDRPITFSDKQFDGQSIKAVWESKPEYNITVTKGTANPAKAAAGTVVTLTADASPSGMVFDKDVYKRQHQIHLTLSL